MPKLHVLLKRQELDTARLEGKIIIVLNILFATTTIVHAFAHANHVYVGSLLNGKALVDHILAHHAQASVLIICSGSLDRFNFEDFHGAGHLVNHFTRSGDYTLTDSAIAALHAYRGCDSRSALLESRVGQMMTERGLAAELDFACNKDTLDTVPALIDGTLIRIAA